MNRPDREADIIIEDQPYWSVSDDEGRPCIYSIGALGDYYISVFDCLMMNDEPMAMHEWYKTVAPTKVMVLLKQ